MKKFLKYIFDFAANYEGNTKSCALIRILLVFVVWSRWAPYCRLDIQTSKFELLVSIIFFLSTSLMCIGFFSRINSFFTFCCLFCLYYIIPFKHWTVEHHEYLLMISTLFISMSPCHLSLSLDRYISLKNALKKQNAPPQEYGNLFALRLIQLQVSVVYFWGAYDKMSFEFLSGFRLQQIFLNNFLGSDISYIPYFEIICLIIAISTVILELALAFGLYFKKILIPLLISGTIFHTIMYATLVVHAFSALMCVLYLAYLDPSKFQKIFKQVSC